jgi:hypothetical protein
MKRLRTLAAFTVAVATGAGCVNTDTAIFVEAGVENPVLAVVDGPLGATLEGGFDLTLRLGARASGASETAFVSFSIKSADETQVLVEDVPVTSGTTSPVTVEPDGEELVVSFTVDQAGDVLPSDAVDALCAGDVVFSVVLDDSLSTTTTLAASEPFTVSGCP